MSLLTLNEYSIFWSSVMAPMKEYLENLPSERLEISMNRQRSFGPDHDFSCTYDTETNEMCKLYFSISCNIILSIISCEKGIILTCLYLPLWAIFIRISSSFSVFHCCRKIKLIWYIYQHRLWNTPLKVWHGYEILFFVLTSKFSLIHNSCSRKSSRSSSVRAYLNDTQLLNIQSHGLGLR